MIRDTTSGWDCFRLAMFAATYRRPVPEIDIGEGGSVLYELIHLLHLEPGWDGYNAEPIKAEIVNTAIRVARCFPDSCPQPQVVPMSRGRLQFEWNAGPVGLEIEITTPETITCLFCPSEDRDSWSETNFDASDTAQVANWIKAFALHVICASEKPVLEVPVCG